MTEQEKHIIENLTINKLIHVMCVDLPVGKFSYLEQFKKNKQEYSKDLTEQPLLFKEDIPEQTESLCELTNVTPYDYPHLKVIHQIYKVVTNLIRIKHPSGTSLEQYGINKDEIIYGKLKYEMDNRLLKEVIARIFKTGEFFCGVILSKWQRFLVIAAKFLKIKYEPKVKITSTTQLKNILCYLSNLIFEESKEGPGNFVIMNKSMAFHLVEYIHSYDFPHSHHPSNPSNNNLIYFGIINNLKIYIDSNMSSDDNRICVGIKEKESSNLGIKGIFQNIRIENIFNGFEENESRLFLRYILINVGNDLCKAKYKTLNLNIKIP